MTVRQKMPCWEAENSRLRTVRFCVAWVNWAMLRSRWNVADACIPERVRGFLRDVGFLRQEAHGKYRWGGAVQCGFQGTLYDLGRNKLVLPAWYAESVGT